MQASIGLEADHRAIEGAAIGGPMVGVTQLLHQYRLGSPRPQIWTRRALEILRKTQFKPFREFETPEPVSLETGVIGIQ